MHVLELELQNFRRFSEQKIHFGKRLTVFAGINGAGKSTALAAVSKLLSWYVRRMVSPQATGAGAPIAETDIRNGSGTARIAITVDLLPESPDPISWSLAKSKRAGAWGGKKSDLSALAEYVKRQREDGEIRRGPVLVAYGVNRAVLDVPLRIKKHHDFTFPSTYDHAFDGAADFRTFFEWFREKEDLENERIADHFRGEGGGGGREELGELAAVKQALRAFLPDFSDWRVRRSPLRMEVTKTGETFRIEQLSDGEKNMIAMVGDLARRLTLASGTNAHTLDGTGIVLIDEVELHLHPAWQRYLLPRLLETFPGIQFLVTTHSPLVLAQLNVELHKRHREAAEPRDIEVLALRDGHVATMLDPETGLLLAGEMDEVVNAVDEEFNRLLEEEPT